MNTVNHIRYLKRDKIDISRWDTCIETAPNGLIYGRSFYLDAVTAGRWDALVWADYQAVMPLTWNRKFGFHYLYQPFFTSSLGIFGSQASVIPVAAFLQAIPRRFRYWDIDLNETNIIAPFARAISALELRSRLNYLLPLDRPYDAIQENYKRLARRMQKKAAAEQLEVVRGVSPEEVIGHYRHSYADRHSNIPGWAYERIIVCANRAQEKGLLSSYLAKTPGNTVAAFYLVFSDNRFVYSVLGGSTREGKEKGAFYLLTDAAIRDHAGAKKIFRFEGSDIPGIALFNSMFGPTPVHYPHLVLNRLPFPINLLK